MSVNVDTPTRNEHLGCPGWYIGVISGLLTSYSRYQAFVCKLAPIGVLSRKPNASRMLAKPKSNPKAKFAVLKLNHIPDSRVAVRHQCSSSFPCSSQDWQLFKLWKFCGQLKLPCRDNWPNVQSENNCTGHCWNLRTDKLSCDVEVII